MTDSFHAPLRISPSSLALVLVDFQEEHRLDERFLAADYGVALGNAARLLTAARDHGVLVVHGQYVRDFAKEPPRPFEIVGDKGEPGFSDASATDFIRLSPEVEPRGGEMLIVKNDASCFTVDRLGKSLTEKEIEWLVVAGAWTEACVAATVRDAISAGFRVLLVKDACASGTALMHRTAVLNLANRLLGGAVADTGRALEILSGREADVWRLRRMVPFRFDAANVDTLYDSL